MEQKFEVISKEKYGDRCLKDSIDSKRGREESRRPRGEVEIYEVLEDGSKKLIQKRNLILYQGREMLAQALVGINNSNVTTSNENHFVTWFGLGTGGVDPADPLDPVAPIITEDELNELVMINATDASNADYHVAGGDYPETGYYKKPFDNVEFEPDILNDNRWLVIKITTTVGPDDANGYNLSEAGLYSAASSSPGYGGQFALFARVTYPTIVKTDSRRISFIWYLYV